MHSLTVKSRETLGRVGSARNGASTASVGWSRQPVSEALQQFASRMSSLGFNEYCTTFDPFLNIFDNWAAARDGAAPRLRPLVDLFLLGRGVRQQEIENILGDDLWVLEDLAILGTDDSGIVRTCGISLICVWGHWLFCQVGQQNPTLYFGSDSYALASRLAPVIGGRALDLCAGPGVQSLQLARFAKEVVSVEINPVAAALAQLNVAMNGLNDRVSICVGDLYGPVRGQQFDTIVANPPLLPYPDELVYPFVGHGGNDGLRITRKFLDGLPDMLTPRGVAQTLGCCLSDGLLPLCVDEFRDWSRANGMDMIMTVASHVPFAPGMPFFDTLVQTGVTVDNSSHETASEVFGNILQAYGADHLSGYFLHVRRGEGQFQLQDLAGDSVNAVWRR